MKRISLGWSLAATIAGCGFILFAGGTDKGIEGWQPLNDQLEQVVGVEGEKGMKTSSANSRNGAVEDAAPAEAGDVPDAAKKADPDTGSEPAGNTKDLSLSSSQGAATVSGSAGETSPQASVQPESSSGSSQTDGGALQTQQRASASESAVDSPSSSVQSGLINVNTADAATLMELPGIGEAKAQAIIDYRKQFGPFRSIADLMNVKGIGPKMLEKMKPYVGL
ncbi:helix-hairpin-helix domain-containing protein [Paenibacillus glucanolyticus]|uniref:ComEA family DNA-binding protein n=1 Tax=Paenibacillus glucanolyticus TaxID=59843 RepID=UPI0030C9D8CC